MEKVKDWVEKWKKDVGVIRSINDQSVILQSEAGDELFFGHFLEVPDKFYEYKVIEHSFSSPTFRWEDRMKGNVSAYGPRAYAYLLKISSIETDEENNTSFSSTTNAKPADSDYGIEYNKIWPSTKQENEKEMSTQRHAEYLFEDVKKKTVDFYEDKEENLDFSGIKEKNGGLRFLKIFSFLIPLTLIGMVIFFLISQAPVAEYTISDTVIIKEVEYNENFDRCEGIAEYQGQEIKFHSDEEHYEYLREHIGKEVEGDIETEERKNGELVYTAVWFWYELK